MPGRRLLLSCVLALLAWAVPASAQAQTTELPAAGAACDEKRLGPDEKVLVFSRDHRVPARFDRPRAHRDLQGRGRRRHRRRLDRGLGGLHRRDARPVRRGRVPLHHRRPAEPGRADGVRGVHPGRRRLRRHPRRIRHRVRLGVVRRAGRQLLRQPPGRAGRRPSRSPTASTRRRPTCRSAGSATTSGTRSAATRAATCTCSPRSRRPATSRATAPWASTIRSRGATTTTAGAPGTPAAATRRRPSTTAPSAPTCSAGSSGRPTSSPASAAPPSGATSSA